MCPISTELPIARYCSARDGRYGISERCGCCRVSPARSNVRLRMGIVPPSRSLHVSNCASRLAEVLTPRGRSSALQRQNEHAACRSFVQRSNALALRAMETSVYHTTSESELTAETTVTDVNFRTLGGDQPCTTASQPPLQSRPACLGRSELATPRPVFYNSYQSDHVR